MPTEQGRMTADEFRAALDLLGLSVSAFAELLVALGDRANDKLRTVQRWAAGTQDIPGPVQALLQLLVLLHDVEGISPEVVRGWVADAEAPEENDASP